METCDGYHGIWYWNQESNDEYVYKYSGGLGTYCAKHTPMACYAPEVKRTFFCYGGTADDANRLVHMVSYYDHEKGVVPRPTFLIDKQTDDAHDNPVLSIDETGHVWVFSSSHGTERPSWIWRSRQPYAVDDFERVLETNFSYPQPWWIPGEGFCFLRTQYQHWDRALFVTRSADGREWSEPEMIAYTHKGHYQVSARCGRRVGTCFNMHPEPQGLNWRTNLYYMETEDLGRTWTNAAGAPVKTPVRDVQNNALTHDFQAEGKKVYLKDITFDGEGHPVLVVVTSEGFEPGPENGPRFVTTVRWTGSEWDVQAHVETQSNYDTGCLHVEPDGAWRMIFPTEPGPQPYNPGGEMVLWTSDDQGHSWTRVRDVTRGSAFNHTYARKPIGADPGFYAFWADGHARQPSESRLYFCDREGVARRLPEKMTSDFAEPELL
jgi:putative BNR repeat neuraminidase